MRRTPRPYQQAAHDAWWAVAGREVQSGMIVMPTGTGKTEVAAMVAGTARKELGVRTLFVANREFLVDQAEAALSEYGLTCLVEMASRKAHRDRLSISPDVVVATTQTMHEKRLLEHWHPKYFGLIIQDECHRAASKSHRAVPAHFPDALHLGLTATPSGGKIVSIYGDKPVYQYKIRDAIREGYLSPVHLKRIPIAINLKEISTVGGDFNLGELSERISPKIEELADGIISYGGDRYGVVFTPDVGCALAMAQALTGLGCEARYVAGHGGKFGMPKKERKAILRAFNRCQFQVIVCCDLLFEGWDAPHVSLVVNSRPTYKLYRFQQMAGRGTRLCHELGKEDVLVLDFDWQTDQNARDLAAAFDLFSEELDDRVKARVKKKVKEKEENGEEVDLDEEIEEAESFFKEQDKMLIRLTGKKLRLVGKEFTYDPIGVGNLIGAKLVKRYDIRTDRAGRASEKQIAMLMMLGVANPGEISTWGATKLIKNLQQRRKEGLATPDQLVGLRKCGVNEEIARVMTTSEAQNLIEKRKRQGELFK